MESNNGNARVAVPTHFYKIILHTRPNGFIEAMAFLLPHVDSSPGSNQTESFLISKLVAIDDIEAVTSIDFLVGLRSTAHGSAKENAIEGFKATSMWARE
jgi:DNA/RNA endonuclease G (NUC1)